MLSEIFEYLSIYLFGTFKFVLGPAFGVAAHLNIHLIVLATALGTTTTAFLFSFFGDQISAITRKIANRKKKRKVFTKRNRRFVKIWVRYGVAGVAFLTPLLFSPVVGAILANAFGGNRRKIVIYMAVSAVFWGYILTLGMLYFSHLFDLT